MQMTAPIHSRHGHESKYIWDVWATLTPSATLVTRRRCAMVVWRMMAQTKGVMRRMLNGRDVAGKETNLGLDMPPGTGDIQH